jgi:general secretion pathway protein A
MYESYFGFQDKPFNPTHDPRYLYLSPSHRDALAHLVYGIQEKRGFVVITGEVGTGKTTLSVR